jgi:hypothetical protein
MLEYTQSIDKSVYIYSQSRNTKAIRLSLQGIEICETRILINTKH